MKGFFLIAVIINTTGFPTATAGDINDTGLSTGVPHKPVEATYYPETCSPDLFPGYCYAYLSVQEPGGIVALNPDRVRLELALDPLAVLIDVRMKFEYRKGHIERALHLPKKKDLDAFAASTQKHRPLYLYCTTETRARQAGQLLIDHGFERVYVIEGGLNKWKAYNLPVERGKARQGGSR